MIKEPRTHEPFKFENTESKDFSNSSMNKWINTVEQEILSYIDKYENIILTGHSMGGLLSILMAVRYNKNIKKLVLLSTPLRVSVNFRMIVCIIKMIL